MMFLIENGADPDCSMSEEECMPSLIEFCKGAAAHANGRRLDVEAWRAYWETIDMDKIFEED